jgi:RNA polymerase sigma factor (sigma-70 family)
MARVSNREIVELLKSGDRLGCRHLVDLYQEKLLGEAVHVFHLPAAEADELVSDVLLAVIDGIGEFAFRRSDGDFHLWVMTIFRNKVRDFVRQEARQGGLLETFDEAALEDEDSYTSTEKEVVASIVRSYAESISETSEDDPEGETGSVGKAQVIVETLERMETWERVLLRCRALDVPYEDISKYTNKPVKLLKVYHGRVRQKFVRLLAEHYPELATASEGKRIT